MKEFKEILEEIRDAEEQEKEFINRYMKVYDLEERHESRKAAENDMLKASTKKQNLQITIKILKNNAKIALFNEVLPIALKILTKYENKPYGEKTKEKINNEIEEKTNCRFYITSRYDSYSFDIYPIDGFGSEHNITCGAKYTDGGQKPLLIDNKIQLITFDEIELYYISREYVEDIPQRVEDIKAAYVEAVAKQEELNAVCNRFNNLAVGDIGHIYSDKHIYTNMDI